MRRIMILGAGRGQVGLIKAAKKCGYETVVATPVGDYPGIPLADWIAEVDIRDEAGVLAAAERFGVEGAATSCLDVGMIALGNLCDKKGFRGISRQTASLSVNKLHQKEVLAGEGVTTANYVKVSSEDDLDTVLETLHLPLIVKPVDLAGSKGIYTVHDAAELKPLYEQTMAATKQDYCIVEEFIEGYKFGATAFVAGGEILFVLPCADVTVESDTTVPIGHYVPVALSEEAARETEIQVSKAICAMGIDNSAVNADLILKDGDVYVVEITGRLGSNCLPELTSIYYGTDIFEMIAKTAMGDFDPAADFDAKATVTPCFGQMIISEETGTLKSITNANAPGGRVEDVTFFVKPGSKINKFRNTSDCLGQIVVSGGDIEDCRRELRRALDNIAIELE